MRSMRDSPPPSTITSGSSRLITWATARARRVSHRASVSSQAASPCGGAIGDLAGLQAAAVAIGMVALQPGAAHVGLDAAALAAEAQVARLVVARPRQRVVAPLAGQAVRAVEQVTVHDDAGTDAGAEDAREHHFGAGAGTVGGLRQREAVGIVGHDHRLAEQPLQVAGSGRLLSCVELQFFITPRSVTLPGAPMPMVQRAPPAAWRARFTMPTIACSEAS